MAAVPLFVLLFFIHPRLLHSAEEQQLHCPQPPVFNCGKLSNLEYPFTSSAYPECGLLIVSGCNDTAQMIQLHGRRYEVELVSQSDAMLINDPVLREHLSSNSCKYFDDLDQLALPSVPFMSWQIVQKQTMFKCNRTLNIPPQDYKNLLNASCNDYNIYYSQEGNDFQDLQRECSIIQVPINSTTQRSTDLFGLLTARFFLQVQISMDCWRCYDTGGSCDTNSKGRFHCAKAKVNDRLKLKLKLGLVISATGVGSLMILAFLFRRKYTPDNCLVFWKKQRVNHENIEAFLRVCGSLCPKRYSYLDIKKMTDSFKEKLGEGGFGGVYKGKLHDGRYVAVKVLKGSKGNGEDFINEVSSISRTSHINIVTLLGFCFEGRKRALVYEFMANGSLEKFIYEKSSVNADRRLKWEALFEIAVGIARGLAYLHRGCSTRILHFDIKPHNILLDEDFCPKISDFGLAKICPRKESIISMLGTRGTAGYIAPEVFSRNFGGVSHKSDVYSYGMMVFEMVGGRRNIDCEAANTSEIYFPHWIYKRLELDEELGLQGIVNEGEKECARKMIIVSMWCIQTDPSNRSPMSRVVEMLEGSLESLQIPPKPFLSSPSRSPADSPTISSS